MHLNSMHVYVFCAFDKKLLCDLIQSNVLCYSQVKVGT